ncbi:probable nuclear transport factor 2 isoform X3 [Schistocerca cancellata]|uniref:probable nuclear transport factor 2 isoform X3 n=1 Tax=Schistocerca cancellata TaxID=274614 RepID=UPI00211779E1|nr:probable nuclear transport factor 2 isoform X3 [Schistocerca cancellata]
MEEPKQVTETSFMTFEGLQIQGAVKIMEKLTSLAFQKINRIITAVDSQPMFDGGVLINVLGRLQCDEDPPHAYSQVFVLKPVGNSFYCQHDIFRLSIHDSA